MRRAPAAPDAGGAIRSGAAALRRRLADERGFTLSELIVVMAILGIVLVALTTLFVSATNAQVDLSNRVDAQQNARLALDKLRREIHCAKTVTGSGTSITITLGTYCPTNKTGGEAQVTWCTLDKAGAAAPGAGKPFTLWRYEGAACSGTGQKWADHLTTTGGSVFPSCSKAANELSKLHVDLTVDLTPNDARQRYKLQDDVVLRNSDRTAPAGAC